MEVNIYNSTLNIFAEREIDIFRNISVTSVNACSSSVEKNGFANLFTERTGHSIFGINKIVLHVGTFYTQRLVSRKK